MKKLISFATFLVIAATASSAQVYECEFNPQQTRGWAPKKLYIDTERKLAFSFTEGGVRVTGSNPYYWRERLLSNAGFRDVRYTVRIGKGVETGEAVSSRIQIEVKGTQSEETRGRCKIYVR